MTTEMTTDKEPQSFDKTDVRQGENSRLRHVLAASLALAVGALAVIAIAF